MTYRPTNIVVAFVAAALASTLPLEHALAQTCRQLESELASAERGGDSAQARKYDDAIAEQERQIDKTRSLARANGCGFHVFGNAARAECASLNETMSRMKRNLSQLRRTRAELGSGGSRRDRGRILAALDANGCRESGRAPARDLPAPVDDRPDSVRAIIDGGGEPDRITRRASANLRTLCVRTCDGYFFPISNRSGVEDLTRDAKICQARCPGTDVRLYHHRFPDEEVDQMVSAASGEPYSVMTNAFAYRRTDMEREQGCGCNAVKNFSIIAGELPRAEDHVEPVRPVPRPRPDPAADPETLANREGALDTATLKLLAPRPDITAAVAPEDRAGRVRVVGPAFLPDPEEAIDLRSPGRTGGR